MKKDFDIVIFGGTGDLALRKLLPSLYRANYQGEFEASARIFVTTRKVEEVEQFDSIIENALRKYLAADELNEDRKESFLNLLHPVLLDAVDRSKGWADFEEQFNGYESKTRVFYLAVMPSIFGPCCENLSHHNLITPNSRVVVEKPIGYDFESAEKINETIALYFQEEQIYRIDHYLGKETVQNLLALRFGNFLFENIWDAKSIDHVQISISEVVGLEGRAGFYENTGAMRDMVQNHLLQLLCLIAMESPNKLQAEDIRVEKIKVLRALKALDKVQIDRWTVAGQYAGGVIDGQSVDSYLNDLANDDAHQSESCVESRTETFVAMKTFIDNWRWSGVPFYLRTGKRLKKRRAEIIVTFKNVSHDIYAPAGQCLIPNRLIIQLQPEEKIQLQLMAKSLGEEREKLKPIKLNLNLNQENSSKPSSDYQRLLLNAIKGDSTLFIHRDEVKAAWQFIDPILAHWNSSQRIPENYASGSWGPEKANGLFEDKAQYWIDTDKE